MYCIYSENIKINIIIGKSNYFIFYNYKGTIFPNQFFFNEIVSTSPPFYY